MDASITGIVHPLTRDEELDAMLAVLAPTARIALDAEGDGFHRYRARLCTLQLAGGGAAYVVDALASLDLSRLAPVLGASGPVKIIHDASFDARILARRGIVLQRVFDTSIAARFLGESATGLSSLLARYLDVRLDKEPQMADWGVRPLGERELEYLVRDVAHLEALAAILEARLAEVDLVEEAAEETAYALRSALLPEPVREPWTRIKGARELNDVERAIVAALAEVREREAQARDVPPFRVASNGALFEAARRRAADLPALRRIRGLAELSDELLCEALETAKTKGAPRAVEEAPPAALRSRWRGREKALGAWRAEQAKARGVNEQAVLPGHCLRDLARLEEASLEALETIDGLGHKRIARHGRALLDALARAST
jgi:ribonuclease D